MITLQQTLSLPGIKKVFGLSQPKDVSLSFCADTRAIRAGEAFIAIDGERFKPMRFLSELKSAPVVIYNENEKNDALAAEKEDKHLFIAVEDSVVFLQSMARKIASNFIKKGGKVIGISGSNGKTTTKEMLYHILKSFEPETECTQKNNNNHIGVPLTLLQIKEKTRFCAVELGSNHPGEIELLCSIALPNVGVTTNIGDTHLEFFHNRENVFKEEGFLYHAVASSEDKNKVFFLNRDDEYLKRLEKRDFVKTYGSDPGNNIKIVCSADRAQVSLGGEDFELKNPNVTGAHNFQNLGVAFSIACALLENISKEKIAAAAGSFKPTKNRSEWIERDGSKIFLDAYNANPSSMRAAIKAFREQLLAEGIALDQTALALGDMNELGEEVLKFHKEMGAFCLEQGFSNVYFIGRYSAAYNEGFGGKGHAFPTLGDFEAKRKREFLSFKRSFIKGSRSLQLESIVDIN